MAWPSGRKPPDGSSSKRTSMKVCIIRILGDTFQLPKNKNLTKNNQNLYLFFLCSYSLTSCIHKTSNFIYLLTRRNSLVLSCLGGERWSKPHVATLSLHSLFELRNCLTKKTVMLDVEATSMETIANLIVEQPLNSSLTQEQKEKVRSHLYMS